MNSSVTINTIAAALVKAQREMGSASKDAKNPFFKSKYADLNSVIDAAIPVLNANGIMVLQPVIHLNGKNFVRTMLLHESGEFLSGDTEVVVAKQNDPQAHGSGISYARRYGLSSFVTLKSEDDDGERAMIRQPTTTTVTHGPSNGTPVVTNGNGAKTSSFKKPTIEPTSGDWQ